MCKLYTPPVCFGPNAGPIWAEVINHLSGYMVTVVLTDGTTVTGELLGDGEMGRYLRLMEPNGHEAVYLARSIKNVTVL